MSLMAHEFHFRQSMGTRDQSRRCPLLLMAVTLPPTRTPTATFPSGRWTPHSWEALECWTQLLSCAASRPTRSLQCSQHPLAPTTPLSWPGSSGLPTGMLSSWPMMGRNTASWSDPAGCCPDCQSILYCLGRCCSVLPQTGLLLASCPLNAIQGHGRSMSFAHASWGQIPHGQPVDWKAHTYHSTGCDHSVTR